LKNFEDQSRIVKVIVTYRAAPFLLDYMCVDRQVYTIRKMHGLY